MTRRLLIKGVTREHPVWVVKPADFVTESGPAIDPYEVLRVPRFSLYCFDPENDAALFVEVDDPEAVDRAPFYYQAQVQHATGLVSMPLQVFRKLAQEIPGPPKGWIFVHSVGRCGSTLVSKVLEAAPRVHSLSEPDDLTQLVKLWVADDKPDAWIKELLVASIRWRSKPRTGTRPDFLAIKPRSEVMVLADFFGSCFPTAKHFFLYREAVSWMRSLFRGFPPDRDLDDADGNLKMEGSWSKMIPLIRDSMRESEPRNPIQVRVLAWVTCMEGYLRLHEMGVPTCAVRFEDLTSNPEPILRQLFEFCGIEGADWDSIGGVLDRDSQAGTIYDREERRKLNRELTDDLVQDVLNVIASRPQLQRKDVIVPATIPLHDAPDRARDTSCGRSTSK